MNFFRTKEARDKIFFTLAMLVIFKIGTYIPAPEASPTAFDNPQGFQGATELLNTFGGGALKRFSIFAMDIIPYITASIVIQLSQMDIAPEFSEWTKQGEVGGRKLNNVTRYLAVSLASIRSIGMAFRFNNYFRGALTINQSIMDYLLIALVLTARIAFLVWLGDQITQFDVGNGIFIITFAGISSTLPTSLVQFGQTAFVGRKDTSLAWLKVLELLVSLILLTVGVIYVLEVVHRIPIQYAKKQTAQRLGSQAAYLPLKVDLADVIPVIFAMAFFSPPRTLTLFYPDREWAQNIANAANPSSGVDMVVYIVLIILFTCFYAPVQVNPEEMADNLKKQDSHVPDTRPGEQAKKCITKVLYRLTFIGSIFLTVTSILPILTTKFMGLSQSIQIGGTSLLIVIGIAIGTTKSLEAQVSQKGYKGFSSR